MNKYYGYNRTSSLISQHVFFLLYFKEHQLHRERLRNIRTSFNFEKEKEKMKKSRRLVNNNYKRQLLIEEEFNRISKENQTLLKKIMSIDRRPNEHSDKNRPYLIQSLNLGITKKKYRAIDEENFVLYIMNA